MRPLPPMSLPRRVTMTAALLCGVTLLVLWSAAAGRSVASGPRQAQLTYFCAWSAADQPDAPVVMNTVAGAGLVKTIAAEKEIYRCRATGERRGEVGAIDEETYVEVFERLRGTKLVTTGVSVSQVTCVKFLPLPTEPGGGLISAPPRVPCAARPIPLQTFDEKTFRACTITRLPRHPVVMDTVVLRAPGARVIKTIKLDKEVFDCDATVIDLYLFTETTETQTARGFKPGARTFVGVACSKEVGTAGPRITPPAVVCGRVATS